MILSGDGAMGPRRSCFLLIAGIVAVVLCLVLARWYFIKMIEEDQAWGSYPPLHRNAARGRRAGVVRLLNEGADVNELSLTRSALFWAASSGHTEIVQILIDHGADVNLGEFDPALKYLSTPLQGAASFGHKDVVGLLVAHGADVNLGLSLCFAARFGRTEVLELLIEKGAAVDAKDTKGRTALHWAATTSDTRPTKILIAHRADINARTNDGRTPLSVARKRRNTEVEVLLRQHGAEE